MKLTLDSRSGCVLARVAGSLDSGTIDDFGNRVRPIVETQRVDLLIDLSETDYLTSEALEEFIRLRAAAKRHSNRLVLVSPTPLVRKILEATRLDAILPVVHDVRDAVINVEHS